jgi:hypothetical protein
MALDYSIAAQAVNNYFPGLAEMEFIVTFCYFRLI